MEYIVKKLTPELHQEFIQYFANLDFSHAQHWSSCFCRYYYVDCPNEDWFKRTKDQNREETSNAIKTGEMQGYLAYDQGRCIGWCSANDLTLFPRLKELFKRYGDNKKIGCVICFVIHPEYRNQGVARLLLKHALDGFKNEGFDAVVAMPFDVADSPEKRYRGTINMYLEQGFKEKESQGLVKIMWLDF